MQNTKEHTILIADDENTSRAILREVLEEEGYSLLFAKDGAEAKQLLQKHGDAISLVLLDWMMPRVSGIELLSWIKNESRLTDLEVIMQSGRRMRPADVSAALKGGAYYYLLKPYQTAQLLAIVQAALAKLELRRSLSAHLEIGVNALRLLHEALFRIRTPDEAQAVATAIAGGCGFSEKCLGLFELLVNGVEHGNLGLSYAEKSRLLDEGRYREEVARLLALPENRSKRVHVKLSRQGQMMEILIEDEGAGFDYQSYLDFDEERLMDPHGRGILMAQAMLDLEYIPPGNQVKVRVEFPGAED